MARPMIGTLRIIPVLPIGELFHAYPGTTPATTETSIVSLSFTVIVIDSLMNQ